jgi:hypothetical protein
MSHPKLRVVTADHSTMQQIQSSSPRVKSDEHFIPLRKSDLIDRLCNLPELVAEEADSFRRLCQLLDATLHFEYHTHFEKLKDAYAAFDPDSDTESVGKLTENAKEARLDHLFDRFTWLLERANFRKLSSADWEAALAAASAHGLSLEVDIDFFDRLEMYSRGETTAVQVHRSWRNFHRLQRTEVPAFQRLVIVFRLRPGRRTAGKFDTQNVFMKLFKDIPKIDLEMLLPGTRVKMSLKDRVKIIMPTVSGMAISAYKAIKGALLAAAAGVYGIFAVLGVTAGYGMRSFYGYLQTKQKYQLNLTESLYYQNLDNNGGVISRLLDEAEEQENREALLAYFYLWRARDSQIDSELSTSATRGLTADELDAQIEVFLGRELGRPVDFEVDDALAKLLRLGLVRQTKDQRYTTLPISQALQTLDRAWDQYFTYNAAA